MDPHQTIVEPVFGGLEASQLRFFHSTYGDNYGYNERARRFHRAYGLVSSRTDPAFQNETRITGDLSTAVHYRRDSLGFRVDFPDPPPLSTPTNYTSTFSASNPIQPYHFESLIHDAYKRQMSRYNRLKESDMAAREESARREAEWNMRIRAAQHMQMNHRQLLNHQVIRHQPNNNNSNNQGQGLGPLQNKGAVTARSFMDPIKNNNNSNYHNHNPKLTNGEYFGSPVPPFIYKLEENSGSNGSEQTKEKMKFWPKEQISTGPFIEAHTPYIPHPPKPLNNFSTYSYGSRTHR